MDKGFTLLEVLVAITVIVLAFVALFSTVTQTLRNHDDLIKKTYAVWVADNVMNQYKTTPTEAQVLAGTMEMGKYSFDWQIVKFKPEDSSVFEVGVQVFFRDKKVSELSTYEAS